MYIIYSSPFEAQVSSVFLLVVSRSSIGLPWQSRRNLPVGPRQVSVKIWTSKNYPQSGTTTMLSRERLRSGGNLLEGGLGEDIATTVANHDVLQPLIVRMSLTETRPLPVVDSLRDEVEALYLKSKRGQNPEDAPDVIGISWRIRKLLGFLKMKVRRHEVSNVPSPQYIFASCSKTNKNTYLLL